MLQHTLKNDGEKEGSARNTCRFISTHIDVFVPHLWWAWLALWCLFTYEMEMILIQFTDHWLILFRVSLWPASYWKHRHAQKPSNTQAWLKSMNWKAIWTYKKTFFNQMKDVLPRGLMFAHTFITLHLNSNFCQTLDAGLWIRKIYFFVSDAWQVESAPVA